jgi:fused signal recognition particle receptor
MAFDWFRRRFQDRSQTSPQADTAASESEPVAETPETEPTPSAEAAPAAKDLLAYAKAAYQNIQRQKAQAESAATLPDTESVIQPEATEAAAEVTSPQPVVTLDADVAGADVPNSSGAEAAPSTSTPIAPGLSTEAQPVPEVSPPAPAVSELTPSTPTETGPQLSRPFWAQADTDRQERLERLRETAIVEPVATEVPEPTPTVAPIPAPAFVSAPAPAAESSDENAIAFDEGFLWSAEVLSAQGRRPDEISIEEITWLQKLRKGLGKTRRGLINNLKSIVGQGPLNQDAVSEIEALLLQADVGVVATDQIIDRLQQKIRQEVLPPEQAIAYLKQILREMLDRSHHPTFAPQKSSLNIWLITGVNGAGKTTTIGKIAHIAQKSGYHCMIAAADTFRAAAVDQIKVWGQRSGVEVIANPGQNTDPAAVVFDAIAAAQSRQVDLLLVDTAGRLQNKKNLMEELKKIRRIIDKKAPHTKVESLLVLDSTLGQNGLRQAEVFSEAAQLTGVVLTKLDGTAKGGIALAVVQQLGLPIRFIGAGEGIEDLRPFSSYEFIEALLSS